MNVEPESAIALLRACSRLEFAINENGSFIRGKSGAKPSVEWSAFFAAVEAQGGEGTAFAVSTHDRDTLLGVGAEGPPHRMRVVEVDEGRKVRRVRFVAEPLTEPTELRCVLEAATRVRNNLVHGGKDRPSQQRAPGHDQALTDAATRVIEAASRAIPDVADLCWN